MEQELTRMIDLYGLPRILRTLVKIYTHRIETDPQPWSNRWRHTADILNKALGELPGAWERK